MPNNNRVTQFIKAKGFYIALAVCIVGASAAAWATAARTLDSIEENNRQIVEQGVSGEEKPSWSSSSASSSTAEARKNTSGVEKPSSSSSSAPASSSSSKASSGSAGASSGQSGQQSSQTFAYTLPLEGGKILNPYSGGELVKNKTLNVWRTHDAVDIQGEKGAKVMAVGDGEIVAVSNDALWGGMVQIRHPDGYTSSYCGVDFLSTLKAGQTVKAGQELGTLGDIPAEISSETHLHLTLSKDGQAVDPASVLPLS
jgi:murein DD-endopeptidase MepM/ murein hydrolase activator NlpD